MLLLGVSLLLLRSIVDGQPGVKQTASSHRVYPFNNGEVILLNSWIKIRESLNINYLHSLDADRLLHNFRINAGLVSNEVPLEGWESPQVGLRGHFTGHYLSACATVIQQYKDTVLRQRIAYMVDELSLCQQHLGGKYLSAFPENDFSTLEKKYGEVWAPYYTYHKIMQGLLDVYTTTGNKTAYQLVLNMGSYVQDRMAKLPEAEIEKILFSAAANPSNEAGGMNEVLENLFAVSKNPAHLKLAAVFHRKWFSQPLANGKDILSGLHSNTHIILVNGFAKRYENTGDVYYRRAAMNFWNMLVYHHSYVNGFSSGPRPVAATPTSRTAEHWGVADHLAATLSGQTGESCVSHNTEKLTATLFGWTAAPKYADAYMNMFYNAILPIQNKEDGRNVYHLPLGSPQKKEFLKENDFRCCNGTGIEAFGRLNENIYFQKDDSLWVNMFIPSQLNWSKRGIQIEQATNFPEKPATRLIVKTQSSKSFVLKLFIPSWAGSKTRLHINGKRVTIPIKPHSYLTISREWKSNDTVELDFLFDISLKTMPDNKQVISLMYGPVLLAFETEKELVLKGTIDEILKGIKKQPGGLKFLLHNGGIKYTLLPLYQVSEESYGVYATLRNEY